jgi:hypothetical protein
MPSYGTGTAWPTEECPFCAWAGKADASVPNEKQGHAQNCPVRLAREACGLAAPVGRFYREHEVGIFDGCETCGWKPEPGYRGGQSEGAWKEARDQVVAHRVATREPCDGMAERAQYEGLLS